MNIAEALTLERSPEKVRNWCRRIHDQTETYEGWLTWCLDAIEAEKQSGWSSGTLLAIHLTADAKILRELAEKIDAIKDKLTQENRQ